ncbi:Retrovirus-related Pol polyprotein from transposon RE1 [Vitis vinifera]|uniref:Retrovirus-related Pol polyprotein from transposon RE1 n=1 Tax=Vitis vinifera TaxID=29760 RepID=A0A438HUL8_VITVI|nr:Retrovirus-related Pol polyprotein from transposon RE1 [Vitis vinifera]
MKDLGSLTYFLGLEVHHSPSGISLNQHKYASDLVATVGLQGATSVDTPMELKCQASTIRYVQGTSTRGLLFPAGNSTRLAAYSDADWAGCADTLRSITGWCVFLGDALISWKSLLAELDFSETDPTPLHADNTSAIQITTNPVYHERTKHIEKDCHSIREVFEARVITLPHISTDLQVADIFTKALPRHRHCLLSSKLMLDDQPASI